MKGFGMKVERLESGAFVLALSGDFDLQHLYSFEEELRKVEEAQPDCIALDLRRLDFIDSSGLRQLLAARRRAQRAARRLLLIGGSPPIHRLIGLAGLRDAFEMRTELPAELLVAPVEQ